MSTRWCARFGASLGILLGLTVAAHGQVVNAERLAPSEPVMGYDGSVIIHLYKKGGDKFNLAALVQTKGRITFNSKAILGGIEALRRLQLAGTKKWLSITKRELVAGRAQITTDDGAAYTIFNLDGSFAGQVESGIISQWHCIRAGPSRI